MIDFIDYHGWFIGNVADIALAAGCVILIARSLTAATSEHPPMTAPPGPADRP